MNIIDYIFSLLCSQDAVRSFNIGQTVFPLCQRCTGLYIGLGLSIIFILSNRYYRRQLPPTSVALTNIISLLIMPIFGFHILDPGPAFRFWTGLIYGNAIAFLVLPACFIILYSGERNFPPTSKPKRTFAILFIFLNLMPFWFPIPSVLSYYLVILLTLISLLCLLVAVFSIAIFITKKTLVTLVVKGAANEYRTF